MKGESFGSLLSPRLWRSGLANLRWGRRGKSCGSELIDASGCPLSTSVYVPLRVMASSTLCLKEASSPIRGSKMLGTRYGSHRLSLFRLYVERNDSLGTLSPIIWLDIVGSCDSRGHGVGCTVDLYAHGGQFVNPVWICRVQSICGVSSSRQGVPSPFI